jgi:hypothetical protein
VAADPFDPIPSVVSVGGPEVAGKRSGGAVGLAVAAVVESAWLLFLGWMAVRGA